MQSFRKFHTDLAVVYMGESHRIKVDSWWEIETGSPALLFVYVYIVESGRVVENVVEDKLSCRVVFNGVCCIKLKRRVVRKRWRRRWGPVQNDWSQKTRAVAMRKYYTDFFFFVLWIWPDFRLFIFLFVRPTQPGLRLGVVSLLTNHALLFRSYLATR